MTTIGDSWKFEWLTSWDQVWDPVFVSLWKTWMAESPTAHVFFEPSVVRAWYETYRDLRGIEPRFLIARQGAEKLVFLPLVYDRGGWKDAWQRSILPAGHAEFDYHDPIAVGQADAGWWGSYWDDFRAELTKRWGNTVERVSLGRLHEEAAPEGIRGEPVDQVPVLDISVFGSMEELMAGGKRKHLRKELRAVEPALEQAGGCILHEASLNDVENAKTSVRGFAAEHSRRWPHASTPSSFYDNLLACCLQERFLNISQLRLGSRVLSYRISFLRQQRFHAYVQAYPEEAAEYSPGMIHFARILEKSISAGTKMVDFGRGAELWKRKWTDASVPLYSLRWGATGIRPSLTTLWQEKVRPRVVRLKRRVLG